MGDSPTKGILMYILDTDIIIWILRKDEAIISAVDSFIHKAPTIISTITIAEVFKNIFPSEVSPTEELLEQHEIIPVTKEIAKDAGYYWQQFHTRIATLSLADCIIAATARACQGTLVTLNTRHFPMTDIMVKNPRRLTA